MGGSKYIGGQSAQVGTVAGTALLPVVGCFADPPTGARASNDTGERRCCDVRIHQLRDGQLGLDSQLLHRAGRVLVQGLPQIRESFESVLGGWVSASEGDHEPVVSGAQSLCGAQSYEFQGEAGMGQYTQAEHEVSHLVVGELYTVAFAERHGTACVQADLLRVAQFTVYGSTLGVVAHRFEVWLDGAGVEVLVVTADGDTFQVLRLDREVQAEAWNQMELEFVLGGEDLVEIGASFDGVDLGPGGDFLPIAPDEGDLGSHTNTLLVGAWYSEGGSFTDTCTTCTDDVLFDGA